MIFLIFGTLVFSWCPFQNVSEEHVLSLKCVCWHWLVTVYQYECVLLCVPWLFKRYLKMKVQPTAWLSRNLTNCMYFCKHCYDKSFMCMCKTTWQLPAWMCIWAGPKRLCTCQPCVSDYKMESSRKLIVSSVTFCSCILLVEYSLLILITLCFHSFLFSVSFCHSFGVHVQQHWVLWQLSVSDLFIFLYVKERISTTDSLTVGKSVRYSLHSMQQESACFISDFTASI